MKFTRTRTSGTRDLTQLVVSVTWSGDYKSCARTLSVELVSSAQDDDLPTADIALGDHVAFYADEQLFDGFVFSVQRSSSDKTMTVTAYDRGIYLNRNQCYYKFVCAAPEDAVKKIAADFGLQLGEIAQTGVSLSRNFMGVTLYKTISTLYTLAAAKTGDKYHIGFELDALTVRKKQQDEKTLIIQGGSNLLSTKVTESIENMVNRVAIVSDDYSVVSKLDTADAIADYGLMQEVVQAGDNAAATAQKALDDGGVSQKITLECIGDVRSVTGRMVAVHESHTGLWGMFWIESDKHTWKRGVYTNKLTVSLKCVMDENEAGSELKAAAAASKAATTEAEAAEAASTGGWAYYNR